jgi:hypothetical protein
VKPSNSSNLIDRTGQTWLYIDRPYTFLCRGNGPQGSTAPWNDWIILDLTFGKTIVTRLYRDMTMERQRWERLT